MFPYQHRFVNSNLFRGRFGSDTTAAPLVLQLLFLGMLCMI